MLSLRQEPKSAHQEIRKDSRGLVRSKGCPPCLLQEDGGHEGSLEGLRHGRNSSSYEQLACQSPRLVSLMPYAVTDTTHRRFLVLI